MKKNIYPLFTIVCFILGIGMAGQAAAQCGSPSLGQTINAVTCTTANVSWSAVTSAMGYDYVVVLQPGGTPPTSSTMGTPTTTASASLTGLTPSSMYFVYVRTMCMNGMSAWSSPITVVTPACATSCVAPASIITTSTATSITMSWAAISGAIGYEYKVNTSVSDTTGAGTIAMSNSITASGLNPNTSYYIHARTVCGTSSHSPWSAAKSAATKSPTSVGNTGNPAAVFQAYPNPTTGELTVALPIASKGSIVQVLGIDGRLLHSFTIGGGTSKLDLNRLRAGIYLLRYNNGTSTETIRLSKY